MCRATPPVLLKPLLPQTGQDKSSDVIVSFALILVVGFLIVLVVVVFRYLTNDLLLSYKDTLMTYFLEHPSIPATSTNNVSPPP